MFKMIKRSLLAVLLLSAAVAPVRIDAINAGALSLIKKILCIGGGIGFAGLTTGSSWLAFKGNQMFKEEKKQKGSSTVMGMDFTFGDTIRGVGILGAVTSAITTYFLIATGLK